MLPLHSGNVDKPSRTDAEAVEVICQLAKARKLQIYPPLARRLQNYNWDPDDVLEIMSGCVLSELRWVKPTEQVETWPGTHQYAFDIDWHTSEGTYSPLFVKVVLDTVNYRWAEVNSFKDRDGS